MKFKRITAVILAVCMLIGMTTVFASESKNARTVLGYDLSLSQAEEIYKDFGIERGSVTELTVTNSEERELFGGLIDDSILGTRSISCVYIELLDEGEGLDVSSQNVTWCTDEIYANALVTSGVTDAKIVVSSPFPVSGTAALTGIYKAYEDMTGKKLDTTAKQVGAEEIVVTSDLADQIGSYDASLIVNEIKLMLDQLENYTDAELKEEIIRIAAEYNVTLTDEQINQLIGLARTLQKMDSSALLGHVKTLQEKLKGLAGFIDGATTAQGKISAFFSHIGEFFKSVADFFKGILGGNN